MGKFRQKPVIIDAVQWDGTEQGAAAVRLTAASKADVRVSVCAWDVLAKRVIPDQLAPAPKEVSVAALPLSVYDFIRDVSQLEGVRCIVVEEGESGTIHITTFVTGASRSLRRQIYRREYEISPTPGLAPLDFHVRQTEPICTGVPASSGNPDIFAATYEPVP